VKEGVTFRWVKTPSSLAKQVHIYGKRVLAAVHAVAVYVGQKMQNEGRSNAPWQDRTGNARSGLFFAVDGFGLGTVVGQVRPAALETNTDAATISGDKDTLLIAFGHTVYYGKYLELDHGGRYAIVMSTMQRNLPVLERMLKDLFRG